MQSLPSEGSLSPGAGTVQCEQDRDRGTGG